MDTGISSIFRNGFSRESILALARSVGFVKRLRDIHPADLIEALVVTSTAEEQRSIASVRRELGRISGSPVEESSFYDRFTPRLVELARRLWICAMVALPSRALAALQPLLAAMGIKDLWGRRWFASSASVLGGGELAVDGPRAWRLQDHGAVQRALPADRAGHSDPGSCCWSTGATSTPSSSPTSPGAMACSSLA